MFEWCTKWNPSLLYFLLISPFMFAYGQGEAMLKGGAMTPKVLKFF